MQLSYRITMKREIRELLRFRLIEINIDRLKT